MSRLAKEWNYARSLVHCGKKVTDHHLAKAVIYTKPKNKIENDKNGLFNTLALCSFLQILNLSFLKCVFVFIQLFVEI